jgi:hypothetical protein
MNRNTVIALAVGALGFAGAALAEPVTTGVLIRGITVPGAGTSGQQIPNTTCSFDNEDVDERGAMEHASVQCKKNSDEATTRRGLPARFNAYCVVDRSRVGGRVITDPEKGPPRNDNHCLLSGVKPADAHRAFGKAVWR